VSDDTEQQAETPTPEQQHTVQLVILAAVLAALAVFFVRRLL